MEGGNSTTNNGAQGPANQRSSTQANRAGRHAGQTNTLTEQNSDELPLPHSQLYARYTAFFITSIVLADLGAAA